MALWSLVFPESCLVSDSEREFGFRDCFVFSVFGVFWVFVKGLLCGYFSEKDWQRRGFL